MYRNVYAQRSSRPDVGLPKKEGNDRISSRLSRAYWPFLPLLHHPPPSWPLLAFAKAATTITTTGLEWFYMKRELLFILVLLPSHTGTEKPKLCLPCEKIVRIKT